jgi:phage gp16-like protein
MSDERTRLYRLLAVARREVGMSEDDYRQMLTSYGARADADGYVSATTMSLTDLERALAHMKHVGFRPRKRAVHNATDWRQPRIAKITALWCTLADAGVVRDRSERAMLRWCAGVTKRARLEWATSQDLNRCVEGLRSWAQRERVVLRD